MTHSQLLGTGRLSTLNGFVIHTVSQSIYLSRNATDTGPDTNAGCNLRWQVPSANRWTFADRCPPLTGAHGPDTKAGCNLRWQVSSADRCPWTGHQGRMQPPLTGALRCCQVPSADRCPWTGHQGRMQPPLTGEPSLTGALRWQVPMKKC